MDADKTQSKGTKTNAGQGLQKEEATILWNENPHRFYSGNGGKDSQGRHPKHFNFCAFAG